MPLYVYDNWSAYDELSDKVPLTEELAMDQLEELLRLRSHGVKFDAYLMDAFWYAPEGGYLEWRKERWPNGPSAWLNACQENGLLPGLWFPANTVFHIDLPVSWQSSLDPGGWGLCCFEGGFLKGFQEVLEHWYAEGVTVFKFDFADLGAAPAATKKKMLPSEIRARNVEAYRQMLSEFRRRCPDAILCAYNGFEEAEYMTWTDRPIRRVVDPKWGDVFDSIYCGDPRSADLPLPNFWRTLDVYADHMVRYLIEGGLPPPVIDNCAFMMGTTGTCYRRGKFAWKSSLLLSLARGGNVHMSLGNLEQFSEEDAKWWAQAQDLYSQALPGKFIGGIPGEGEAYGHLVYSDGYLVTAVNPSLKEQSLEVPFVGEHRVVFSEGSVVHDKGKLNLGPSAMAVVGTGEFMSWNLGSEGKPIDLEPVACIWVTNEGSATAEIAVPAIAELHLIFNQKDKNGLAVRTSGGAPPAGKSMAELLRIEVRQNDQNLTVVRPDDKILWSGLSWAYGIVRPSQPGTVSVSMSTSDPAVNRICPAAYLKQNS